MTTATNILDQAKGLVPLLKETANETESNRRVAPATFDALAEAGILRMCTPKKYGGAELDFQTQSDVLATLAHGCASTSWVATILSAMAWAVATYPDQTQDEVFGNGDPRVSAVLAPTGTLVPVDDGYVLNGSWGYNTGGHGSDWTLVNAILEGMPALAVVPSSDLNRLDDWYASGMAGTGSSTITASNIFVPSHRVQNSPAMVNGEYTPDRHNADSPYFNLPFASVLTVNAGGTPIGIAQGAMQAFLERLPGRAITYTTYDDQSSAPITHLQVGEAALIIDSADAHVRLASVALDTCTDGVPPFSDRVMVRARVAYATGLAREAVDKLFFSSGASAIQTSVQIQRFQRDMQALANHAIMHSPSGTELYGRVLCGLEPNSPLV